MSCSCTDTPACIFPKFADDLVSISVAGDIDMLEVLVQNALDQMVNWADEWDMLLNVSKTKLFGSGQQHSLIFLTNCCRRLTTIQGLQ